MQRAIIDILRKGTSRSAEETYRAFTDLGWTHETTGYLLQGADGISPSKVRTLSFQWQKSERPVYPENIPCRAV